MAPRLVILLATLSGCFLVEERPPPPSYRFVTVGDGFSCAGINDSRIDNRFVCWGADLPATHLPTAVFSEFQAAGRHACAIDGERSVVCWGDPDDLAVQPIPRVQTAALSVSPTHNCVTHVATIAVCWGAGPGATVPAMADQGAFAITAGSGHTCMLDFTTHEPVCWGRDDLGQSTPPAIPLLQIAAGDGYTCGLTPEGALTCWGRALPNAPPVGARFRTVVAGPTYACALDAADIATCWGDGPANLLSPPAVAFDSLALGRDHACGITFDERFQRVVCWGDNSFGQLDVPVLD